MTTATPAFAVLDGRLCRLSRPGTVIATHPPLGSAVAEFCHHGLHLYVREHPFGLLPGVPNLYCLDADFRTCWLADWPLPQDPCGRLVEEAGYTLLVESMAGVKVRLDAANGRVRECSALLAVAS